MTRRKDLREQAEQANYEAVQGGIDGGIRWFLGGVIVFGTAQIVWPFYRGLTIPFKVGPLQRNQANLLVVFIMFWFVLDTSLS